jgi:fatty-acyl-CoA synthase
MGVSEKDIVLPVVPMFHANAWGLPFSCLLLGASQVLPGPCLDAESLLDLMSAERVTMASGVPTVWLAVLHALDAALGKYDLSCLRALFAGGASVPEALIRAFQERHGLTVVQGWGMTETSPVASLATLTSALQRASEDTKYRLRATAGRPLPLIETRVRTEHGIASWDASTMGELEVRGPWVASAYYECDESATRFTGDGWFKTGDLATIDAAGFITIRDRAKDVIKSGGEWISSVALENALMKHPAVAEAAVIGLPHPKWDERPLALVVRRAGASCTPEQLAAHLAAEFKKFWIPSGFELVPAIPRTSVGKVNKRALRAEYQGYFMTSPALAELAATPAPPLTS